MAAEAVAVAAAAAGHSDSAGDSAGEPAALPVAETLVHASGRLALAGIQHGGSPAAPAGCQRLWHLIFLLLPCRSAVLQMKQRC